MIAELKHRLTRQRKDFFPGAFESLRLRVKLQVRMKPYKRISKSVVHKNPWWQYCRDQIELPSGKPGEYYYALTEGSSMVVPVAVDGKLLLVRQYRYTGNRDSIEFPCGGLKKGMTYDENAKNELLKKPVTLQKEWNRLVILIHATGCLMKSAGFTSPGICTT